MEAFFQLSIFWRRRQFVSNFFIFDSSLPEGVEMTFHWTVLSDSADTEHAMFTYLSQNGKDTLADKPFVLLYIQLLASSLMKIQIFDAVHLSIFTISEFFFLSFFLHFFHPDSKNRSSVDCAHLKAQ